MRLRSFGSLTALAIVLVWLAPVSVSGQSRAAGAKVNPAATNPWTAPDTPDGQPDLQGIWLNNDATPLERPKALEGKPFLTDEEVAELKKRAARIFGSDVDSDAAGGGNFFFSLLAEPHVYKNPNAPRGFPGVRASDKRKALVLDPPGGKNPPMALGGEHAGRRHDQLLAEEQPPGLGREPPCGRALHARRGRPNQLRDHAHGSHNVGKALDGRGSPQAVQRQHL